MAKRKKAPEIGLIIIGDQRKFSDGSPPIIITRDDPIEEAEIAIRILESTGKDKAGSKALTTQFPSPPGLKWEDITFTFFSNDAVKVKAHNIEQRYTFAEMGFKDERKGDAPTFQWILVRDILAKDGAISWDIEINSNIVKDRDTLKAHIKITRKILRDFFGIDEDPFYPYRQTKAYKPKFRIKDGRQGAGLTSEQEPIGFWNE